MLVGVQLLFTRRLVLLLLMASTAVESGIWYNNYHTDMQLAAESLQVQRQALLAILRPYMNRPDEINLSVDGNESDEVGQQQQLNHHHSSSSSPLIANRKEDIYDNIDQSTIHLRVLRSTEQQPKYNWMMTGEIVDEYDGQPSAIVMESRLLPSSSFQQNQSDHRSSINHTPMVERRSIPQFGGMVTLYTRTSPLRLLYYGNWCGSGGMGPVLDDIDKCCMTHDKCYNAVENLPCLVAFQKPYTVHYAWRWSDERKTALCLDTGDRCAYMTCQCDKAAANCFSKYVIDKKLEGSRLRKHRKRGPINSNTIPTLH